MIGLRVPWLIAAYCDMWAVLYFRIGWYVCVEAGNGPLHLERDKELVVRISHAKSTMGIGGVITEGNTGSTKLVGVEQ